MKPSPRLSIALLLIAAVVFAGVTVEYGAIRRAEEKRQIVMALEQDITSSVTMSATSVPTPDPNDYIGAESAIDAIDKSKMGSGTKDALAIAKRFLGCRAYKAAAPGFGGQC